MGCLEISCRGEEKEQRYCRLKGSSGFVGLRMYRGPSAPLRFAQDDGLVGELERAKTAARSEAGAAVLFREAFEDAVFGLLYADVDWRGLGWNADGLL